MIANTPPSGRANIQPSCWYSDHIASAAIQACHRIPPKHLSALTNVPSVQIAWKMNLTTSVPTVVGILNADLPASRKGSDSEVRVGIYKHEDILIFVLIFLMAYCH